MNDVLEARRFSTLRTQLKCLGNLALVYTIKQMAIVNQEARPSAMFETDFGQHQIEAENLHVGDALAALSVDMVLERAA